MIKLLKHKDELTLYKRSLKETLGFVPTMGNLHKGHLELVKMSLNQNDETLISIFVNPTQFGEGEDFTKYPRTLEADLEKIKSLGKSCTVFAPETAAIYGNQIESSIKAGPLGEMLEGNLRAGHFDGVLTVVDKLFELIQPNKAYFGKKDYQQLKIIQIFTELKYQNIQIIPCDTVREPSGLAMSSRNGYLSPQQSEEALTLYQALSTIEKDLLLEKDLKSAQTTLQSWLDKDERFNYLSIRRQDNLEPPLSLDHPLVILGNYQLGKTRLLDNIEVNIL